VENQDSTPERAVKPPEGAVQPHEAIIPADQAVRLGPPEASSGTRGKEKLSNSSWSLGCPVARRCPSGRFEAELCYLVVGASVWPGEVNYPGTLGASSE
jgi:hypothetical protein